MVIIVTGQGTMKIKTADEDRELVYNMSSNEYPLHTEKEIAPRKKGMIDLNTHDALLVCNKPLVFN